MIRLTVANTALDLPQRATVTVQGFNPALDDDSTERTFSFPFRLDATGRNLMALGYANRLDTDDDTLDRPALLELDGATFQGQIEVNSRTSGTIEVVFQSAGRKLMGLAEQVKINEILPTINIAQTIPAGIVIVFDPAEPPDPIVRLVDINGTVYGGDGVSIGDLVDEINADYPTVAAVVAGETMTIQPGAYSPFVLTNAQDVASVTYTPTAQAQHDNFLDYFASEVASPSDTHAFPVVYAPGFLPKNTKWRRYLNYQHGTAGLANEWTATKEWWYSAVPFVRLAHLLDLLKPRIGIEHWHGFLTDPDFARLLIWNNYTLDRVMENELEPDDPLKYLQAYKTQIVLNQHVPDRTGRELLNEIAGFFNLYFQKVGNTVTAKFKRAQLDNVPIDWTDKVAGGHDLLMKTRGGATLRFALAQKGDATDVGSQLDDYVALAPGTTHLDVPFRPLHDIETPDPMFSGSQWCNAYTAHTGTNDEGEKTDAGLRLLFDFGEQEDNQGRTYWQSSRSRLNMAGDPITDFDLDWPGEHGLYEKFWRGWAELIANAPSFQLPMRLEGHEIEEMNRWDNPLRYFRTPNGTVRAIIKSFEHRRSASGGKAETTVEFLRL